VHRKNIPIYISNKKQRYTVYFMWKLLRHVSGGTTTHHQERKQQHLVFVTQLLLPAAIAKHAVTMCKVI